MRSRHKDNSLSTKQLQFEWKVSEDGPRLAIEINCVIGELYFAAMPQRRALLRWVRCFGLPMLLLAVLSGGVTYGFLYRGQMGFQGNERTRGSRCRRNVAASATRLTRSAQPAGVSGKRGFAARSNSYVLWQTLARGHF